jgi:hypothetical protein
MGGKWAEAQVLIALGIDLHVIQLQHLLETEACFKLLVINPAHTSLFVWKEDCGDRPIRFGDDPKAGSLKLVGREQTSSVFERVIICLPILSVEKPPVSLYVPN